MNFKFQKGDSIISETYGEGIIYDIDPTDKEWRYNVRFKDGTGAWISGRKCEKISQPNI